MPDDPPIAFEDVRIILDETVAMYRSLIGLDNAERNRRMAAYLAQHAAFEDCGAEDDVAWGRVKNGGLVIYDCSGNDPGPAIPPKAPPSARLPEEEGDDPAARAEKIREKTTAVTSQIGPLMAGVMTLSDEEWQAKYAAAVASLRSLAEEVPGTEQEKKKRDAEIAALLEMKGSGPEGRQQQASAFVAAFSSLMQALSSGMAPSPSQGTQQGSAAPKGGTARPVTKYYGLPYSKVARLYTSFASTGWFNNAYIALKKYDYDVEIVENAGIKEYMTVPQCGVLAVSAHSSDFSVRMKHDPDKPGAAGELERVFSLYTASPVNYATWKEYLPLWHKGFIAIYHPEWEDLWCNWGITDLFVLEYWKFAKNSFVYLDSCHPLGRISEGFRQAIHRKGANIIGGWTWRGIQNIAGETASYLFDRLLGANEFWGVRPVSAPPEKEATGAKQRPFDWPAVEKDMKNKGLGRAWDEKYAEWTELQFDVLGDGDFGLLRPSIKYVEMDEEKSTLTAHGIFGRRQNRGEKVTVGGKEIAIKEGGWEIDRIVCKDLPKDGQGSEGPVVVEINGIKSNSVPLTGWHADFTYTIARNGAAKGDTVADLTFPAFIRGDVHRIRDRPGEKPRPRPTGVLMVRDQQKKLNFSIHGTQTHGKRTYSWSGSGTMIPGEDPDGAFVVSGSYQVNSGAFPELYVDIVTPPEKGKYTIKEDGKVIVKDAPLGVIVGYDYEHPTEIEVLHGEEMWDPQFGIDGKTRTWTLDFTNDHNPKIFTATFEWKRMDVQSPPDEDTES
jgi:hypothetical protein